MSDAAAAEPAAAAPWQGPAATRAVLLLLSRRWQQLLCHATAQPHARKALAA
jgi:hypothetical protein